MSDRQVPHPAQDDHQKDFVAFLTGSPFSLIQAHRQSKSDAPNSPGPHSVPDSVADEPPPYDYFAIDLILTGTSQTQDLAFLGEIQIDVRSGMLGVKLNGSRDNPGSPDEVYAEQRIYTPPPDGREPSDSDFRWLKAPNAQSDKEFKLQPGDRMILAGFNHQIWNMDPDAPCEISVVRHGYGLRDQPKVEGPCNPCYRYPP